MMTDKKSRKTGLNIKKNVLTPRTCSNLDMCERYKKQMILIFLVSMSVAFVVGLVYSGRPEQLYFCTIAIVLSIIALLYDNETLNSLVVAYVPIYAIIMIATFIYPNWWAFIIHGTNFVLSAFIAINRWRKTSPIVIIVASIFYLTFIISTMAIPSFGSDIFFKFMNPLTVSIYFLSIAIISFIVYLSKQNRELVSSNKNATRRKSSSR